MPKLKEDQVRSYRRHKQSGQAIVSTRVSVSHLGDGFETSRSLIGIE